MKDKWLANGRTERNLLLSDETTSSSTSKRISDCSINPESIMTATTAEMSCSSWLSSSGSALDKNNHFGSSHKSLSSSSSSFFTDQPKKLDTAPVVPYHRPPSRESLDRKKKHQQEQEMQEQKQMEQHLQQQLQDQTYYTRKDSLNYKNLRTSSFRNKRSSSSSVSSYFNTSSQDISCSSWGSSITSFRSSSLNTRSTSRCSITIGTNTTLTTKSASTNTGGKAVLLFDMTDQMLQEHDKAVMMRGKLQRRTSHSHAGSSCFDDDIYTSISSMTSYNSLSFGDDGCYINKNYYHNTDDDDELDETESYNDEEDDTDTYFDDTSTSAYDDEEDDIYDIDEIDDEDDTIDGEDEDVRLIADGVVVAPTTTAGDDGVDVDSDDCSISTCSSLDISPHDVVHDGLPHPAPTAATAEAGSTTGSTNCIRHQGYLLGLAQRPLKSIMKKRATALSSPTTYTDVACSNNISGGEPILQQQLVNVVDSKHKKSKKNTTAATRKTSTKIQFDGTVLVKEIAHLNDMADVEIQTLYMNSEEAYEIRFDCLQLVQQLEEEGIQEDETNGSGGYCCIRGLEKHTAKNNEQLLKEREMLYASVFKIQSLCLPPGLMDVEATIADICIKLTAESTAKAYQFGLLDAQEASKEYNR